jgi:Arc-like DNA binding domain
MDSKSSPKLMVRLPSDVKQWLADEAARNACSQSSEVVRAVREKMDRHGVLAEEAQDAS